MAEVSGGSFVNRGNGQFGVTSSVIEAVANGILKLAPANRQQAT